MWRTCQNQKWTVRMHVAKGTRCTTKHHGPSMARLSDFKCHLRQNANDVRCQKTTCIQCTHLMRSHAHPCTQHLFWTDLRGLGPVPRFGRRVAFNLGLYIAERHLQLLWHKNPGARGTTPRTLCFTNETDSLRIKNLKSVASPDTSGMRGATRGRVSGKPNSSQDQALSPTLSATSEKSSVCGDRTGASMVGREASLAFKSFKAALFFFLFAPVE